MMMYIISTLIILINLIFNRNKYVTIISGIFLWIGMSFNNTIVDRAQYRRMYANPLKYNEEWGYTHLQLFAGKLGLSFQVFFAIIIGICLSLVIYTIIRNTDHPGIVISLYFIFPYLMDAAQVRSFLSACIITAIIPLLLNRNVKNGLLYTVGIFAASMFHYSAYFFLLLLISYFVSSKVILPLFVALALVLMGNIFNLLKFFAAMIPFLSNKIDRYLNPDLLTSHSELRSYAIYLFMLFALTIVTGLILNQYQDAEVGIHRRSNKPVTRCGDMSSLMLKLDSILMLALPLISISVSYDRIIRTVLIIHYIYFSKVFSTSLPKLVKVLYFITLLMFVLYYFWFFIYSRFSAAVFWPFFQGNLIF
ncbi:EpsG family protein [Enterococcus viikkiensis]|uniref:EpsG family protein n=1 Tax=Enterococcus viikkiensis TaxID=930854 RepID=UPI003F9342A2